MLSRLTVLASVLALGAAAACTSSSNGSDEANASGSEESGGITWEDVDGNVQKASYDVPVDHDDPDGETIALSIARAPATGDRLGALFVNPGGPGGNASDFAVSQVASMLPSDVTERFDIVGVDPRGLGESAIDCGMDYAELYGVDPTIESPEDQATLLDVSQKYVDGCDAAAGDLLDHLGTRDVARDMDAVREAMGDDQLSFLGYSYGTAIGQVYADLFPDRVRAMVLDGVVELGKTGPQSAVEQAVGFERALDAFAQDCDADSDCPLAPDSSGAIQDLIAKVEAEPVPASPRDLGPGELATGMARALYSEMLWPDLSQSIDRALDDDGSPLVSLADQYLRLTSFDVYFAVNCLDFAWPEEPEQLLDMSTQVRDVAPHLGEALVNDYVRCSMWPASGEPLSEVTAPGTPPIVVVSVTNDPATPYEAGVNVADRLESGVLLTYEGEGHGVVGSGVPCVDDAVTRYLVDLEPPADDTTC